MLLNHSEEHIRRVTNTEYFRKQEQTLCDKAQKFLYRKPGSQPFIQLKLQAISLQPEPGISL